MLSPLYGQLSPLRVPTKAARTPVSDSDAEAYLIAVEAADASQLEQVVADAINDFVVGCKSDGIWSAIKSSCILAGARTLSGALVPLVGTAPTNNNFVTGDYNRETGLKGNASTKRLNANRLDNVDPQNSKHISVYQTESEIRNLTGSIAKTAISAPSATTSSELLTFNNGRRFRLNSSAATATDTVSSLYFWGASRSGASTQVMRFNGANTSSTLVSSTPSSGAIGVFNRGGASISSPSDARISFYSIGENIDLAALDTRVSNLMTALAAAIP
jgi:hypothetical protein